MGAVSVILMSSRASIFDRQSANVILSYRCSIPSMTDASSTIKR